MKPPIIEECVAYIECRVVNRFSTGDHTLFIGEVLAAYVDGELFDGKWQVERAKLLQHVGGDAYTAPSKPFGSGEGT